jgi:hypothetical protein
MSRPKPVQIDVKIIDLRERAHFSAEQAEGPAALAEAFQDQVATKSDIAELRAEIEHRFESLEQRMTIKIGGMLVVAVGALTALLKLIH